MTVLMPITMSSMITNAKELPGYLESVRVADRTLLDVRQRQVVEQQMGHQTPASLLLHRRAQSGGGRGQAFEARDLGGAGDQGQFRPIAAVGQPLGQVAVAAGQVDRQHLIGGRVVTDYAITTHTLGAL